MCMTVCALCPWRTEEDVRLLRIVTVIVSHPTWAMESKFRPIYMNSMCSQLLSCLCSIFTPAGFVFDFLNGGGGGSTK